MMEQIKCPYCFQINSADTGRCKNCGAVLAENREDVVKKEQGGSPESSKERSLSRDGEAVPDETPSTAKHPATLPPPPGTSTSPSPPEQNIPKPPPEPPAPDKGDSVPPPAKAGPPPPSAEDPNDSEPDSNYGTLSWDGGGYTGELRNGTPHGQGRWTHASGKTYTGEFEDGSITGYGTMVFPGGEVYVGDFKNGAGQVEGLNPAAAYHAGTAAPQPTAAAGAQNAPAHAEKLEQLSKWMGFVGIMTIIGGVLSAIPGLFAFVVGAIPGVITIILGVMLRKAKTHADAMLYEDALGQYSVNFNKLISNLNTYIKIMGILIIITLVLGVLLTVFGLIAGFAFTNYLDQIMAL